MEKENGQQGLQNDYKWGDVEEDISEIQFPSTIETIPDSNGVKTITEYFIEDGKKTKTVRTVQIVKRVHKVKKEVMERRKMQKFGKAEDAGEGPEVGITEIDKQMVVLHLKADEKQAVTTPDDNIGSLLSRKQIVCSICGAKHLTISCPERAREQMESSSNASGIERRLDNRGSPRPTRRDDPTVRISNLPPSTEERDVHELVRRFGHTSRVYLARDYVTNESKGFAFVSFMEKSSAERAIAALNGHGYGHLILIVEWAKPANN